MSSIIVAEDHPMFRAALVLTLQRMMPGTCVHEVGSHDELVAALTTVEHLKLVLLDLMMPGARGLSSLLFMRGECPDVPVAIISGGAHEEVVERARQLGARAFISKSAPVSVMGHALAVVLRGELWFANEPQLDPAATDARTERLASLTTQQSRVLKYLVEGLLNKQIADRLSISEGTVRAHVTEILRKLGVRTRTQAALLVTEILPGEAGLDENADATR